MNNEEFLKKVKEAFYKYLETGSRSNEKLKILHGVIATDLSKQLSSNYKIHSLGYGNGKEVNMIGRYMDKKVDIAVEHDGKLISAIALKFIMRSYSQNSNNYFESMLGETANIRADGKPYFQIFILPSKVPYFNKDGEITKIQTITEHNLEKYIKLSNDNINDFMHTPNKTLIYLINIPDIPNDVKNSLQYIDFYQKNKECVLTGDKGIYKFGDAVIYNDYETFINKVVHTILAQ